jgi:hypothetical protein
MIKIYSVILIFSLFFYKSYGQINATISGRIIDSTDKKSIPLATITLYSAIDSSIITYRLSDGNGNFKVPSLPIGLPMRIIVSVSGYQVYRKNLEFSKGEFVRELGQIALKQRFNSLDEVVVISEIPPVIFRKDTIEFNAASFKTLPTALVEDLLRKLPSVEVADDGSIRVQGKPVSRILVDGKRFFGDNYKMATKNLPANIIDKVQVVDDLEQYEFRRVDADLIPNKVINLTFKKGVKKGWFGRVYGGGGSKERYELGGIANLFRDTLQLSLIGYENNVNRSSFSLQDMRDAGGFNRSGTGSISISRGVSGEKFNINGISFGGGTTGVNRSNGFGGNLNHAPSKNLSLFAQYFYGFNKNEVLSNSNTSIPLVNGMNLNRTSSAIEDNSVSHNLNAGLNWKIDSLSRIQFSIGYVRQLTDIGTQLSQEVSNDKSGLLSRNSGALFTNDSIQNLRYTFSYSHRFARTKKSFSLYHAYNKNNNPLTQITESTNNFFYPQNYNQIFAQFRNTNSPTSNKTFSLYFEDELNKTWGYSLNSNYEASTSEKNIQTFLKSYNGILYDSLVLPGTSNLNRKLDKWNTDLNFVYKKNKFRLRSGISFTQQWIKDEYKTLNKRASQHLSNILFNLSMTVNKINIQYFERVQPPSIQTLIPVPDNSNPFIIIKGNPDLQPTKSRYFNTYGNFTDNRTGASLYFVTNSSFFSNSIVRRLTIDSFGLQTNTPENVELTYEHTMSLNYNRKYKNKNNFTFGYTVGIFGAYLFNPVLINSNNVNSNTFSRNLNFSLSFNWNNKLEITPRYTYSLSQNRYTKNNGILNDIDFVTQNFEGSVVFKPTNRWTITTNYKYFKQSVFSPIIPPTSFIANADITYSFLENKRGQLKFYVNDLFNTNRGVIGSLSGTATTITTVNILNRYFLVSFFYDIKDWSKRKAESNSNLDKLLRF